MKNSMTRWLTLVVAFAACAGGAGAQNQDTKAHPIVLHAARLLDVRNGRVITPGEVLIEGERIVEVGKSVKHPAGTEVIDLGDRTLLPGLIDAHVHLFLHPGAEDLQTVQESVPQRTITATLAAVGMLDRPAPAAKPRFGEVVQTVTARSSRFAFTRAYKSGEIIKEAGTVIAHDGETPVTTPEDDMMLVLPSLKVAHGHTAVRLARMAA